MLLVVFSASSSSSSSGISSPFDRFPALAFDPPFQPFHPNQSLYPPPAFLPVESILAVSDALDDVDLTLLTLRILALLPLLVPVEGVSVELLEGELCRLSEGDEEAIGSVGTGGGARIEELPREPKILAESEACRPRDAGLSVDEVEGADGCEELVGGMGAERMLELSLVREDEGSSRSIEGAGRDNARFRSLVSSSFGSGLVETMKAFDEIASVKSSMSRST